MQSCDQDIVMTLDCYLALIYCFIVALCIVFKVLLVRNVL